MIGEISGCGFQRLRSGPTESTIAAISPGRRAVWAAIPPTRRAISAADAERADGRPPWPSAGRPIAQAVHHAEWAGVEINRGLGRV